MKKKFIYKVSVHCIEHISFLIALFMHFLLPAHKHRPQRRRLFGLKRIFFLFAAAIIFSHLINNN